MVNEKKGMDLVEKCKMSHLAYKTERRKIELAFYSANNYTAVNKLTKIGKHCFNYVVIETKGFLWKNEERNI